MLAPVLLRRWHQEMDQFVDPTSISPFSCSAFMSDAAKIACMMDRYLLQQSRTLPGRWFICAKILKFLPSINLLKWTTKSKGGCISNLAVSCSAPWPGSALHRFTLYIHYTPEKAWECSYTSHPEWWYKCRAPVHRQQPEGEFETLSGNLYVLRGYERIKRAPWKPSLKPLVNSEA